LEELDVDGRVILKWLGKSWNGFAGDGGSHEYGKDFPASIRSWESLE
jgi:hypothetical protein